LAGVGETVSFVANVTNAADKAVTWSVKEGASGGAITPAGVYTAPATVGIYHVVATSKADPTKSDTVGVQVRAPGVVMTPAKTLVVTGETQQLAAQVIGSPSDTIVWTVQEGAAGGTVSATGLYTAPTAEGSYHVVATSTADSNKSATALVTVAGAGKWINVTPQGVSLSASTPTDNYGAQQVVADTANPGTFLVAVTYQGVWKTNDFGATWTRLTSGDDAMDHGRPSMEIAPDGSYIVSTLLYPNGSASNGCWKSVAPTDASQPELGKVWRLITVPGVPNGDDMGGYHIDPSDKTHVIGSPHSANGNFYESFDSAETWKAVPLADSRPPFAVHLIDSNTVLTTYDAGSGNNPQLARKSGSTWTWKEVTTKDEKGATVAGQTSFHSDQQIFVDRINQVDGKNVVYLGGPEGIHRSSDGGLNWTKLNTPAKTSQGLVGTPTHIYSTAAYANAADGFPPSFMAATRTASSTGSTWTAPATPSKMNNGWLKAAIASNGSHYVIVAGMWNAGIWIFIEP
jgi:hypothetical protein